MLKRALALLCAPYPALGTFGLVSSILSSLLCLCAPGLAVGLDPEGYGNPDFCWLSIYDTLIWSFAGPVAFAVSVSAELG